MSAVWRYFCCFGVLHTPNPFPKTTEHINSKKLIKNINVCPSVCPHQWVVEYLGAATGQVTSRKARKAQENLAAQTVVMLLYILLPMQTCLKTNLFQIYNQVYRNCLF